MSDNIHIFFDDFTDWNKKIVFSSNATGKTRVANEIFRNDADRGGNPQIFTARKIHELVTISEKSKIYIGKTSSLRKWNEDIELKYSKKNGLDEFASKYYSTSAAKTLSNSSAVFGFFGITNIKKGLVQFYNSLKRFVDDNPANEIDFADAIIIDKKLESAVIKNIAFVHRDLPVSENKDGSIIINANIRTMLIEIQNYQIICGSNICYLCGKSYTNSEELRKAIEKSLSLLSSNEINDYNSKIDDLLIKIRTDDLQIYPFSKFISFTSFSTYVEKISFLIEYKSLFNSVAKTILLFLEKSFENLKDDMNEYNNNVLKIDDEQSNLLRRAEFQNRLLLEFSKLVYLPSNVNMSFDDNALQVVVNAEKKSPLDVLSESEIKRLALAVLNSIISFERVSFLILDDPIDSYDDYYVSIASTYLAEMLEDKNVQKWAFFSHLYTPTQIVSYKINFLRKQSDENATDIPVEVYYQDIDYVRNYILSNGEMNTIPILLHESMSSDSFSILKGNEIEIFRKVLKVEDVDDCLHMDFVFALLSFFPTIRGTICNIISSNLMIDCCDGFAETIKVVYSIERTFLHFSPTEHKQFADLLKLVKDLYVIKDNALLKNLDFGEDIKQEDLVECRDVILMNTSKKIIAKSSIIKSLLFKMLWVSKIKHDIEYALYKRMTANNVSQENLHKLFFDNITLKNRILFALQISNTEYKDFDNLMDVYGSLINDFSHGLIRMFPPYLSTSVVDIAKLALHVSKM